MDNPDTSQQFSNFDVEDGTGRDQPNSIRHEESCTDPQWRDYGTGEHDRQIYHRDLDSQNVSGTVKLIS